MIKRLFDIVCASFALLVSGPLILIAALAVKFTSPGPAFYRAKRAGLGGKPFELFKLRAMRLNAETPDRKITSGSDSRITSAGHQLRKFKLDELPQFWNVPRGQMPIIAPATRKTRPNAKG